MFSIYHAKDASKKAYLVTGTLQWKLEDEELLTSYCSDTLIGILEYFLGLVTNKPPIQRILSCSFHGEGEKQEINFDQVESYLSEFKTGMQSMRILALILEQVKKRYIANLTAIGGDNDPYLKLSKVTANLAQNLEDAGKNIKDISFQLFIEEIKASKLYKLGRPLLSKSAFSRMTVRPNALSNLLIRYMPGSVICKEKEIAYDMYILLKGSVEILSNGHHITFLEKPGEVIGELGLFLEGRRTATMVARDETQLMVLNRDNLEHFFKEHPKFFSGVSKTIAKRIQINLQSMYSVLAITENNDAMEAAKQLKAFGESIKKQSSLWKSQRIDAIYKKFEPIFEGTHGRGFKEHPSDRKEETASLIKPL